MSGPVGSQQWMYSSGFYPHEIGNSARLDTNSYFQRTPSSSGSRTTWTWNAWVKLGSIGQTEVLFTARTAGQSAHGQVYFEAGKLAWDEYNGSSNTLRRHTTQLFRDPSAWYMVTIVADTTNATASNRGRVYINGTQVTDFSTTVNPTQNQVLETNQNITHRIGANTNDAQYFNGYTAEVNFVDGQALDPSYFGETKADTWIPKKYTGSYGTNGYYLPFNDAGFLGKDASTVLGSELVTNGTFDTNINNWTAHNGATLALSNNRLSVHESPGFDAGAYQAISVESGKTYSIEATVDKGTTNGARVGVEYTLGGRDGVETSSNTGGHFQFTFTPSSTGTVYVRCFIQAAGTAYFDNISVKEITTQGNDFTSTNVLVTDQMLDSPTNNWGTLTPIGPRRLHYGVPTLTQGNLTATSTSSSDFNNSQSTVFNHSSGKWYYEVRMDSLDFGNTSGYVQFNIGSAYVWRYYDNSNTLISTGGSFTSLANGDILMLAVDQDNGKGYFGINGGWYNVSGAPDPAAGTNPHTTFTSLNEIGKIEIRNGSSANVVTANFGQDSSFAGQATAQGNTDANGLGDFYYAPPAGFLALCTANLPDPVAAIDPALDASPQDHFNTVLYTGNGSSISVTGVGFQPDWVWFKRRDANGTDHEVYDAVRGVQKYLLPNTNNAEGTISGVTSFDSDGFTYGSNTGGNNNGSATVAWNWKAGGSGSSNSDGTITSTVSANTGAGFSIVTYTGTGSSATIGHGLGQTPKVVFWKRRGSSENWSVQSTLLGAQKELELNGTAAESATDTRLGSTANWTSSVVAVNTYVANNASSGTYVAYCFAEVGGFSKFGTYTGNGEDDGPFIDTGFRPAWILLKRTDVANNWVLLDNKRDPYNVAAGTIYANQNYAENANYIRWDMVSNGFKLRKGGSGWLDQNALNGTYFYMAFAEMPFKYANAR